MSVPSTKLTPYILNVHNLLEGVNYSTIVTATNSVGVSAPFKTSFTSKYIYHIVILCLSYSLVSYISLIYNILTM